MNWGKGDWILDIGYWILDIENFRPIQNGLMSSLSPNAWLK